MLSLKTVTSMKNKKDYMNYLWNKIRQVNQRVPFHNRERNQKWCLMPCHTNQSQRAVRHPEYQRHLPLSNHKPNLKHIRSLNHKLDHTLQDKLRKKNNLTKDHKSAKQVRWVRYHRCVHQLSTREDHPVMWANEVKEVAASNRLVIWYLASQAYLPTWAPPYVQPRLLVSDWQI